VTSGSPTRDSIVPVGGPAHFDPLSAATSRLIAGLLIAFALFWPHASFHAGWIPHDEGLLAMSAMRVLHGQVPHVDFQDAYSGGLSLLHALAFRWLGESIGSLRTFHLWVFHAFQLLLLWTFRRWLGGWLLAALALIALTAWTAPAYPASTPSWYVAYLGFLALTLCVSRDQVRTLRLALCGVLAGLAFAIKLTGIFVLPALALGLWAYGSDSLAAPPAANKRTFVLRLLGFSSVSWLPALLLVRSTLSLSHVWFFFMPLLVLAVAASARSASLPLRVKIKQALALGAGFAAGCAPLLAWCASREGGLRAFLRGVFIEPALRMSVAAMPPPRIGEALATFAVLVLLGWALLRVETKWRLAPLLLAAAWIALGDVKPVHRLLWTSLRTVPLLFAAYLLWGALQKRPWAMRRDSWLVGSFAAFMNLTQVPYAFGIYVLYCMPFFLACALAVTLEPVRHATPSYPLRMLGLLTGLSGFGLLWVDSTGFRSLGVAHRPRASSVDSNIARLGIAIEPPSVVYFLILIEAIHAHSRADQPILAFPDTPETYFLSNRANPVRWPYDFFGPQRSYVDYLGIAEQLRIPMLVINLQPEFSRPPSAEEVARLRAVFPHIKHVRNMLLLWREKSP
jgi:hypothetical protein